MKSVLAGTIFLLLGACSLAAPAPPAVSPAPDTVGTITTVPPTTVTTLPVGVVHPPEWLGSRPLPLGPDGLPQVLPTPPELVDRRFATIDFLPPPPDGRFRATVEKIPPDVLARSTWHQGCPVAAEELAYVTVAFVGFDGLAHTGELLVAEVVAADLVEVFRALFEARFPIEAMVITSSQDLETPATGDGNVTTAFVCRPVTGGSRWSEHAYGLAVDINPFHNPYVRGDRVIPELATAYLDRDRRLPGMIHEGDVVTTAFDAIGWEWGGRWSTLKDYHHFSLRGR